MYYYLFVIININNDNKNKNNNTKFCNIIVIIILMVYYCCCCCSTVVVVAVAAAVAVVVVIVVVLGGGSGGGDFDIYNLVQTSGHLESFSVTDVAVKHLRGQISRFTIELYRISPHFKALTKVMQPIRSEFNPQTPPPNMLTLHLVLLAPVNSCALLIILYYAFCSCTRVAVCLPMFFPNKTNRPTNTHVPVIGLMPHKLQFRKKSKVGLSLTKK